jgi:hypothetical protein
MIVEMNPSSRPLIALLADNVAEAATARGLNCNLVHLLKPGTAVSGLVIPDEKAYTVDYGDLESFERFVNAVLRPLHPDAVAPLDDDTVLAGAMCNQWLGLRGLRPQTVASFNALTEQARHGRADGDEPPDVTVATFTVKGSHRVIAVAERLPDGRDYAATPPAALTAERVAALSAVRAATESLARLDITDGPATFDYHLAAGSTLLSRAQPTPPGRDMRGLIIDATGVDIARWSLGWPLELGAPAPATVTPGASAPASAREFASTATSAAEGVICK